MFKKFIACTTLFLALASTAAPVHYGLIAPSHSTPMLNELRKTEVQAIQNTLHEPVQLQIFSTDADALNNLKDHPNELTLIYAKQSLVPQIQQQGNWKKIAQLLEFNPSSNTFSTTYSAYLVASKKSNVNHLSDLTNKKIAFFNKNSESNYEAVKQLLDEQKLSVQWIQAKDLSDALSMVATGKADAAGVWSYYFTHAKDKGKLKVLYKIKGLQNPTLYGNANNLHAEDIKAIQNALKQEVAKKNLAFSYN